MAAIKPFTALRPRPDLAVRVCELPYDVMSSEEARHIAAGNPLSFLHISKPDGLNTMPCVTIDGISYTPGSYTGADATFCTHINPYAAIIPLMGGRMTFTLENLKQPPVFRSWQEW